MRDTEIVASIVAGDPDGLAMAYDRYAAPLFKYCSTLLSDPADAADAVQDTFVIAASRLDGLRDPERLRAWLYSVARNESLRILRAKKGTSAFREAPDVTDNYGDVSEHAARAQLKTLFEEAAAGLNPGERQLIELQLRQGLEAAEVADVLGLPRNQAHSLLSRARDQLEVCLAVWLVGRAGRDESGELSSMLAGWDGRLTVLLRKRLHRHIEHCSTCTARRTIELRPAMLLGLSPGAALAAGAAASLKLAASTPVALKGHTLALATGHGPVAAAHRAVVAARAGSFGKGGFPEPAHAGKAALAALHGAGGVQGQVAVATPVIAAAIAAVVFALTWNGQHTTPSGAPEPPGSAAAPPVSSVLKAPARRPSPPPPTSAVAAPTAVLTSAKPTPTRRPATSSPPPTSTPTSTVNSTGKLHVTPADSKLTVVPGQGGTTRRLRATGGIVTWSATVSNDPNHLVTVTPDTGTLTSPHQTTVVTIQISQSVTCGTGTTTACPTVTFSPGGASFSILTGDAATSPSGTAAAAFTALATTPLVSLMPGISLSTTPGRKTGKV